MMVLVSEVLGIFGLVNSVVEVLIRVIVRIGVEEVRRE